MAYDLGSLIGTVQAVLQYDAVDETAKRSLLRVLRDGYKLDFTDTEAEETTSITMHDVYAKVQETDIRHLLDMINERDDAITADAILQTVIYGEVIFG